MGRVLEVPGLGCAGLRLLQRRDETVSLQRLYVLFFIELERRQVYVAGVTGHPDSRWTTQQARNLCMTVQDSGRRFKFLIRGRDSKFVASFDEVFGSESTRVIKAPARSPRANAYAERFVQTAWRECLDWILVFGRRHLDRVLVEFVTHYNEARPHRGHRPRFADPPQGGERHLSCHRARRPSGRRDPRVPPNRLR